MSTFQTSKKRSLKASYPFEYMCVLCIDIYSYHSVLQKNHYNSTDWHM